MGARVSVLMPVYNGGEYLKEAIESILFQSFSDFEFLIINDGSTDNSVEIIKSFTDKRIRLINNDLNIGQANSQNKGINMAKGEYIVRMDADDISLPNRIKKQVEFMDANPEIGISGVWIKFIGDKNDAIWKTPVDTDIAKCMLLFQPSTTAVIIRKIIIINNKLFYRSSLAEDYDLWVRASRVIKISNINEVLYLYRRYPEQISGKYCLEQERDSNYIREKLINQLGLFPNKKELKIHNSIIKFKKIKSKKDIIYAQEWLEKLNYANYKNKMFKVSAFSKYLAESWFKICYNSSRYGIWTYFTYFNSKLSIFNRVNLYSKTKFLLKCLMKRDSFYFC